MTNRCRKNGWRVLAGALALVLSAPARGQDATAAPRALPGTGPATPTEVMPLPEAQPGVPGVEVNALGTIDGPPVGLLTADKGGFGLDMWSNARRQTVEALLTRVPIVSADPAVRDLAKRVVLTTSAAPVGPAKRALITIRIEKLDQAGLIAEAGQLAAMAALKNDADFARVQADAILTANRAADACGDATAMRATGSDAFWLELRAYCAEAGGDQALADLTDAVIDAQGLTDKGFKTLADDVLEHKKTPPGPIAHPTALHLFLLQQAGLPVPRAVAAAMGTAANLLALRDARNPPDVRLAAADRIAGTGAASVAELRAVADAQDLSDDDIAGAAANAPAMPFFAGQARLRRAAALETRAGAKAQLLAEALSLGEKAGLLPLTAALDADLLAAARPAPDAPYAGLMGRALLLADKPDAALPWFANDGDPARVAFLALAAPDPAREQKAQEALSAIAARAVADPPPRDVDAAFDALLLGLYDVLGKPMPPDARAAAASREAMNWPGRRPDTAAMRKLESAAFGAGREGEALLRILDIEGARGPGDLAPDVTVECVRILEQEGLPRDAARMAREALLLYQPQAAP